MSQAALKLENFLADSNAYRELAAVGDASGLSMKVTVLQSGPGEFRFKLYFSLNESQVNLHELDVKEILPVISEYRDYLQSSKIDIPTGRAAWALKNMVSGLKTLASASRSSQIRLDPRAMTVYTVDGLSGVELVRTTVELDADITTIISSDMSYSRIIRSVAQIHMLSTRFVSCLIAYRTRRYITDMRSVVNLARLIATPAWLGSAFVGGTNPLVAMQEPIVVGAGFLQQYFFVLVIAGLIFHFLPRVLRYPMRYVLRKVLG